MTELNTNVPFTTPTKPSNWPVAARYGLIWGASGFVFSLIGFLTNTDASLPTTSTGIKAVYMILGIGIAIWCIRTAIITHRETGLGGVIDYNGGINVALKVGAVAGVVGGVLNLIYTNLINTGYMDTVMEATRDSFEKQGMTEDQIDQALSFSQAFMGPTSMFIMAVTMTVLFALIIGLIAASVLKKN